MPLATVSLKGLVWVALNLMVVPAMVGMVLPMFVSPNVLFFSTGIGEPILCIREPLPT